MGREAECAVRFGDRTATGKALLETTELLFRAKDLRLRIPFAEIRSVAAKGGELHVRAKAGTAVFALGAQAPKWAERIQNPPGRLEKLGVKPGMRVAFAGAVDAAFVDEVAARAEVIRKNAAGVDLLFYGVEAPADLERLPALKKQLQPAGAIWVLRAKGAAATVSEAAVMAAGKKAGLVDTKVVAFSPTHTAERLVIPVAKR